jgi:hypothetical protein
VVEDKVGGTKRWSTGDGTCAVYISDWTDSAISLQVGLPTTPVNYNGAPLYAITDMSPLTFFAPSSGVSCSISPGDSLTFTVTNPQQPGNTAAQVTVTVGGTPTGSGSLF